MLKTCSGFTFSIQYRIEEREEKIKSISIFFCQRESKRATEHGIDTIVSIRLRMNLNCKLKLIKVKLIHIEHISQDKT